VTQAVAALASGTVDVRPLLTDVVAVDRAIPDGFERLRDDSSALKILIGCQ
jgi:threonine dehydrogenase-like Zn-dependent dehydrogenase